MDNRCNFGVSLASTKKEWRDDWDVSFILRYTIFRLFVALHDCVHCLYDVMDGSGAGHGVYQTIENIVCSNVPWFLPFAFILDAWFWKKTREYLGRVNLSHPGPGIGPGMTVGLISSAIWQINHVIWTDFVAIVFLFLLIKTVLSSKHLLLIPFKLWQLFYGGQRSPARVDKPARDN